MHVINKVILQGNKYGIFTFFQRWENTKTDYKRIFFITYYTYETSHNLSN